LKLYGLIGYPLTHSLSAQYFNEKFFRENIRDSRYELFPLENISFLKTLVESNPDLRGLNVTIPYKVDVIPLLSSMDDIAKSTSAVNCIRIVDPKNFLLHGYNTDAFGFEESLKPLLKKDHQKALVLGTGGASKAITFVLKKIGVEFLLVSRKKIDHTILYADLNEEIIRSYRLIINATPAGMFPHIGESPDIPYHYLTKDHVLYDLVYNPSETLFMKRGIEQKATVKNGLEMLYLQAERSWQIWNKE
jgi:shikimate dehydrogenase